METLRQWRSHLDVLDVRLFKLGDTGVTLWGLLLFVSLVVALMYLAGWFQRWMVNRVLAHALENADVLKQPPPMAHLLGMTAGAFAFELTAWTSAV